MGNTHASQTPKYNPLMTKTVIADSNALANRHTPGLTQHKEASIHAPIQHKLSSLSEFNQEVALEGQIKTFTGISPILLPHWKAKTMPILEASSIQTDYKDSLT